MNRLEVENISKMYRRGQLNSGSFKQDLVQWWSTSVLRREDPFFKMADAGGEGPFFWALKDISFSVPEGEMFAIVGKNGSGKSTLLKIICRITSPTSGRVLGRGRISSMLEVGTGFSPDLTGRQNIYLSGHILGMSRGDVKQRFDEIVAFSGVEAFIDTPVKRYSSGMYVRLAFSVAAHLQSDIMIIDEVLAVGDMAFQEKCLAKMNEITRQQGRTVLLVSHNMHPVKRLCTHALWLDKGRVAAVGSSAGVVRQYLGALGYGEQYQHFSNRAAAPGTDWVRMKTAEVCNARGERSSFPASEPVTVSFDYWCQAEGRLEVTMGIYTEDGVCVCEVPAAAEAAAEMGFQCTIPAGFLMPGGYSIQFTVSRSGSNIPLAEFPYALYFEYKPESPLLLERRTEAIVQPPFRATLLPHEIKV